MLVIAVTSLLALGAAGAVRRRRVSRRWVSPYARFRAAAARVTRTGEGPFHVAGATPARPTPLR